MATTRLLLCLLLASVLLALWRPPAEAAVPVLLNYQGKLTTAAGAPVADGTYNMRFSLWDAEAYGTQLWIEPAAGTRSVTVTDGLFNVLLGSITPMPTGAFSGNTWLATEVNGSLLSPRVRIVSAGYAIRAQVAEGVAPNGVTSDMIANGTIKGEDLQLPFRIDGDTAYTPSMIEGRNAGEGFGVVGQIGGGSGATPAFGAAVFGDSAAGPAVLGFSKTAQAVSGVHTTSGNFGQIGSATQGVFGATGDLAASGTLGGIVQGVKTGVFGSASAPGLAGRFDGDVSISGQLNGPGGPGLPVASVVVLSDGSKHKGSSNVTTSFDAGLIRYLVTIAGEQFNVGNHIAVVTPLVSNCTYQVGSGGSGAVDLRFFDLTGSLRQTAFSLLVYRL